MKLNVKLDHYKKVNELPNYWTNEDFLALLDEMGFTTDVNTSPKEVKELLYMCFTDQEPAEAARIALTYKLGEQLNEGQIQSISHEMTHDKIAEEYPEPALHYDLFNINQLLFKAYNGTFPNTEASIFDITITSDEDLLIDKEIIIKALAGGISDRTLILRLFADQIDGTEPFDDANKIIWKFSEKSKGTYEVITSTYWLEKDDIVMLEYKVDIAEHIDIDD